MPKRFNVVIDSLPKAQARPAICGLAVTFGGFNTVSGAPVAVLRSYYPASNEVGGVHSSHLASFCAGSKEFFGCK